MGSELLKTGIEYNGFIIEVIRVCLFAILFFATWVNICNIVHFHAVASRGGAFKIPSWHLWIQTALVTGFYIMCKYF